MDIGIRKGERDDGFPELREQYLDSLCEPTELYYDLMCRESETFDVVMDGIRAGYVLLSDKGVLLGFFIEEGPSIDSGEIFAKILEDLGVEKALCQSLDHLFISLCLLNFDKKRIIGFSFRNIYEPSDPIPQFDLTERRATLEDVGLLSNYSDGIFEESEIGDIPFWVKKGGCMIFEDGEGSFVGYGLINRTIDNRDWFDIGMYVRPEMRNKGYGTHIIDRMADVCFMNEWRPTAGCDKNNVASKKTLEKAGFVSKHVLVEFRN